MPWHLYIIADGGNTKIGISSNLERRLPAYKTHNPNYGEPYKTYPCSEADARRVESAIKAIFKDKLTGGGKERFAVDAEEINRYVCTLLDKTTGTDCPPALHGVRVTDEATELLNEIDKAADTRDPKLFSLKQRFAEVFAKAFSLGIPQHRLPEDLLFRETFYVDLNHAAGPESSLVREAVTRTPSEPYSDHVWGFYHLLKLSSGDSIAVCTAKVSMPYLARLSPDAEKEVFAYAKELGLHATFHPEWSWHYPNKTGLILYQPKTPFAQKIRQWDQSYRKWVIERQGALRFEDYPDTQALTYAIEDICDDRTLPLDAHNYDELHQRYLGPYFGFCAVGQDAYGDDEEGSSDSRRDAHVFLINKWRAERKA